jgi:hypothetical protein
MGARSRVGFEPGDSHMQWSAPAVKKERPPAVDCRWPYHVVRGSVPEYPGSAAKGCYRTEGATPPPARWTTSSIERSTFLVASAQTWPNGSITLP